MLKATSLAGISTFLVPLASSRAAAPPDWQSRTDQYLASLARPTGGYAWPDQADSHLTPTFAVVGCLKLLGRLPTNKASLAQFVRTHHPAQLKGKLEQEHREFEYQQIQSLIWLDEDASAFKEQVSSWKRPTVYLKQYEQHCWPVFRHELTAFTCRALLGLPLKDLSPEYIQYLDSRRRPNGSFNTAPAAEGGDGHILNTWWGLQALAALGRTEDQKQETIAWVQSCQLPNGGFTWQPHPEFAGNDDVAYTWAAARILNRLGAKPRDYQACVQYLLALANDDGGFGDRPGWLSNPVATHYALDALQALGALEKSGSAKPRPRPAQKALPENLKLFSIQIEAHGKGSPADAVELARALRIHMWGAKNAAPGWIERAQQLASQRNVPVTFFVANEEYGTWVNVPGLGTYSHTSDVIAPAGRDFGKPLAGQNVVSWPEFRNQRLGPLQKAGGHLVWQFGENEELVRLYLDDSLERGGYSAISTFHFGNPDFTNSEPFLQRWRGRIPFVALQDAHGNEPWWFSDMTAGFRTLFVAKEPAWDEWLKALKNNWVAAVRHDEVSKGKTWIHAGSPEMLEFIKTNELSWRWWDNSEIQRPMVSVVALKPGEPFEAGCPDSGVMIRVRCAWENTAQGLPKKPLTELVELTVDGTKVQPEEVTGKPARANARNDHFYRFHIASPSAGRHQATATVRSLQTGELIRSSVEFTV